MGKEIEARSREAIVFMDEMMDARAMARRIYSDIMDSDVDAANEEAEREAADNGHKPRYVDRNYSAAIAAVREIKSIAIDLAKLALIATKYGDETGKKRELSPAMREMMDKIGVFGGKSEATDAEIVRAEEIGNVAVEAIVESLGNDDNVEATE